MYCVTELHVFASYIGKLKFFFYYYYRQCPWMLFVVYRKHRYCYHSVFSKFSCQILSLKRHRTPARFVRYCPLIYVVVCFTANVRRVIVVLFVSLLLSVFHFVSAILSEFKLTTIVSCGFYYHNFIANETRTVTLRHNKLDMFELY